MSVQPVEHSPDPNAQALLWDIVRSLGIVVIGGFRKPPGDSGISRFLLIISGCSALICLLAISGDLGQPDNSLSLSVGTFLLLYLSGMYWRAVTAPSKNRDWIERLVAALVIYIGCGLSIGFGYADIELHYPGSFRGICVEKLSVERCQDLILLHSNAIYLSFVTISSTGYGDITPVTLGAKFAVVGEMIVGYLMNILLIAVIASYVTDSFTASRTKGRTASGS